MRTKRVEKLEQVLGGGKRMIVCRVRAGHVDEDRTRALADAAVTPGRSDLVVTIRKFCHDETTDCPFEPTVIL